MSADTIRYEILEDGTISITTDQVSGTNHVSADKLLKGITDLAGGQRTTRKRSRLEVGVNLANHQHFHNHIADGHTH